MFDIGFAELVIIGVVALLVVGPERLPETIRTASGYLNRIRRGFNDIKREVQQELHNDAVMRDLKDTGEQLKRETSSLQQKIRDGAKELSESAALEGSESSAGTNIGSSAEHHEPTEAQLEGQREPQDTPSAQSNNSPKDKSA